MVYNVCVCVCVRVCVFRIQTINKITKTWSILDSEKYYAGKLNREEVGEFRESWEGYNLKSGG